MYATNNDGKKNLYAMHVILENILGEMRKILPIFP